MAVCWSCSKVKGKRVCPARGGSLICSKCCGTKRRVEIQCPADCPYLGGADPHWHSATRQKEDARFLARFLTLNETQVVFLLFVHHLMLTARGRFALLSDNELREVVETALKTLETTSKGIVYHHHSSSPHLDPLANWLAEVLSRREAIATAPEASDSDLQTVLQTMIRAIRDHEENPAKHGGYLATAEQVMRSSLGDAPAIELPGNIAGLDEGPTNLIVSP